MQFQLSESLPNHHFYNIKGGLLGDVFLHTLPHEMNHENGEVIGLAILAGFLVFLLFDILVRSYSDHDHCHGHSHENEQKKLKEGGTDKKKYVLNSAAVLNLAADSLHNFTDGIAIGASFAGVSYDTTLPMMLQIKHLLQSRGGLASLAVLFHEIPHELGDYAILVSAGMTKNQAILAQFSTAIAAYCGTFVGLFGVQSVTDYVGSDIMTPFVAGGFVYLSTVTILSGLLEQKVHKKARVAQVLAFLVGVGFMYGVAMLEHAGGECGHGHSHAHHDHGHVHATHDSHNMHIHAHGHANGHTHGKHDDIIKIDVEHEHKHNHDHDHDHHGEHHEHDHNHHHENSATKKAHTSSHHHDHEHHSHHETHHDHEL